jgi:hypothetical protein
MTAQGPNYDHAFWRIEALERRADALEPRLGVAETMAERHEQEIYGERGINRTVRDLALQVRSLQRSLWGLAASILIATLVFALSH